MTFLAPWFLVGILAAGIPLILHLRRSRQRNRLQFSTTQFFDERFIRSARRARLQDLLLMILRMALLALLALALAQPLVRTSPLAELFEASGAPRQVAIVLDDSASMQSASQRGVLLDRAKQGALDVIDELSTARGDRATVVLAGQRETGPRVLFDKPTPDLDAVRREIRKVNATDLATDLDTAVTAANKAIGGASGSASTSERREIFVFSDMQRAALQRAQTYDLGPTTGMLMVSTRAEAQDAPANLSIDAIQYGAARPMLNVPFTFRAMVTNHGSAPRTTNIELRIGEDVVEQREIEVPAGRPKLVRFTHRFTEGGWHGGEVRLTPTADGAPDAMPVDDARHFALTVADQVRVLAVNGAPSAVESRDELFFLRLAFEQTAADVRVIQPDELNAAHLDAGQTDRVVVLANVTSLPEDRHEALAQFVDQGGSVLITLGDRVNREAYNNWIGDNRLHGGLLPARLGPLEVGPPGQAAAQEEAADDAQDDDVQDDAPQADADPEDADDAGGVSSIDEHHPILAGFQAGELGQFNNVRFDRRYELTPSDDNARILMRGQRDAPLLVEKQFGKGRVMLFASSIDRDWTNFPLQPTYVPWLYRTMGYLAQPTVGESNFKRTGQIVALPRAITNVESIQIERPDGTIAYPDPDPRQADNSQQALIDTDQAGVYTVRATGQGSADDPGMMFAANVAPEESQTQYHDESTVTAQAGSDAALAFVDAPESVASAGQVAREGYGLWDVLLWLALAVALVEPWLANQLSKRRGRRITDALGQRDAAPVNAPTPAPERTAA